MIIAGIYGDLSVILPLSCLGYFFRYGILKDDKVKLKVTENMFWWLNLRLKLTLHKWIYRNIINRLTIK